MNAHRNITARWRNARAAGLAARRTRAINQALIGATPAQRDELLQIASRY
ncbi:MAG: hypothetical protein WCB04_06180 [Mycobacteriales bacterium]